MRSRLTRPLGLGAAAALLLTPAVASADPADTDGTTEANDNIVELNLFNLTDVHGHIEQQTHYKTGEIIEAGGAAVGCYLDAHRDGDSSLTLLGDNIGASPFTAGVLYDNPTIEVLNALNPVASTIGNHELDLGQEVFKARVDGTSADVNGEKIDFVQIGFPYLGANVEGLGTSPVTGRPYLDEYELWTSESGVKVAFIGAIAEDVPYKLSPGTTEGMTFNDPIAKVNQLAQELKESDTADVVVVMLDDDVKNNYPKMGKYVDGLMGGDTHVPYSFTMVDGAEGNKLSATASGSYIDNLSNLKVYYNTETGEVERSEVELIPAATLAECGDNADIKAIVDRAVAEAEEAGNKVVADNISDGFYRAVHETPEGPAGPGSNRGHESSLGDLAADAMKDTIFTTDQKPVDIGIINAGGLRDDLVPGEDKLFTYAETYAVMPFSNELGYVTITGAEFKNALEQQWKTDLNSQNSRPLLKLGISSNVQYTYDPARPYGDRITSVLVDGEPLDEGRAYTIGSVTFLLAGGDSFPALTTGGDYITSGDLDRDKFNEYLQANDNISPRMQKSSIGITVPSDPVAPSSTVDVNLRGLSFTEGPAITENATVNVDGVDFTGEVDNSLVEPNASTADSVITTDGAGQATIAVTMPEQCPAGSGDVYNVPVTVSTDFAEVVAEAQGISIPMTCEKEDPAPPATDEPTDSTTPADPTDPTSPTEDKPSKDPAPTAKPTKPGNMPHTGMSHGPELVAMAALLVLLGFAITMVVRRHRMNS